MCCLAIGWMESIFGRWWNRNSEGLRILEETVQRNVNARGIAVIIYNSYAQTSQWKMLPGTIKDGEAMKDTFEHLKFATILLEDAKESEIREVVGVLASYPKYPEKYDCFAIVFAGHGEEDDILVANDGKKLNFADVFVKSFNQKYNPEVSSHVANVNSSSILVFIDACRGKMSLDRTRGEPPLPVNMLLGYSTREEYVSYEDVDGGIWMQKLAKGLKTIRKSVPTIMAKMSEEMAKTTKYKLVQKPITLNSSVSIVLLDHPAIVTGGDDDGGTDSQNAIVTDGDDVDNGGTDSQNGAGEMSEQDLQKIEDVLLKCSSDWKKIGSRLGFTFEDLRKIESKHHLLMGAPDSHLNDMLNTWYHKTPRNRETSREDVAKAVDKGAGKGRLAEEIRNIKF